MTLAAPRIRPLDGLRGIAVALTVGYHLPGSPVPGGMVGVDLFFVLSGFLIGGILLDQALAGRVGLGQFWAGRVLRLLPALALMLLATGAAAWLLASPDQWSMWWQELAASSWYGENFYLISVDHDYFPTGRSSPFVHLWSLGVEEQFYLLFPLAVAGGAVLARRAGVLSLRRVILVASAGIGAASFAFSRVVYDPAHVGLSYYDPRSRVYALLAGVALACVATPAARERLAGLGVPARSTVDAAAVAAVAALSWVAFTSSRVRRQGVMADDKSRRPT